MIMRALTFCLQLLVQVTPDPRAVLQRDTLEAVKWHEKQTLDDIRRNGLIALNLDVAVRRHGSGRMGEGQGMNEVWYSEGRDPMELVT